MRIAGYDPLTLIDYPGHVASTVFTQGCPFRCAYCHNPELITIKGTEEMPEYEVLERMKKDARVLEGVCVTGGEPTLHPDLPDFLQKIKELGLKVKLDTNGVNPRLIETCLSRGVVDFIAMDIKHRFDQYTDVIGSAPDIVKENCQKTLELIQSSGIDHEFRTTITSALHDANDLLAISDYLKPGETYALQPVRLGKTLNPDLQEKETLDLRAIMNTILLRHPDLNILIKA